MSLINYRILPTIEVSLCPISSENTFADYLNPEQLLTPVSILKEGKAKAMNVRYSKNLKQNKLA